MNILIVDDEPLARNRLCRMIDNLKEFQVIGEANNGHQALQMTAQKQPDIVLLDIRMPGMDGLESAKHMGHLQQPPSIIFCTAYDEYAINAFEVNAIGYLLKPVRLQQLTSSLLRAKKLSTIQQQNLSKLIDHRRYIYTRSLKEINLIAVAEISHFMADQKYVVAHHKGREIIVNESLKELEHEFESEFIRIHRNCLVAKKCIEKLQRTPAGQWQIILQNSKIILNISRRHLAMAKQEIKQLSN